MTEARAVLVRAIEHGVFPAVTVDVGNSARPLWQDAIAVPFDTLFDLASLTKPIATASLLMRLLVQSAVSRSTTCCRDSSKNGAAPIATA